jgi:hypothetical protein
MNELADGATTGDLEELRELQHEMTRDDRHGQIHSHFRLTGRDLNEEEIG